MKHFLAASILMVTLASSVQAQTVTHIINDTVVCCEDSTVIDIDNDNIPDIEVKAYFVFDAAFFTAYPLQGNIRLSYPKIGGQPLTNYQAQTQIAMTSIGCAWSSFIWSPGTGIRYVGFYRVNAPADTTFGWIKMDFRGDPYQCGNSLFIFESVYSSVPNVHLVTELDPFSTHIVFTTPSCGNEDGTATIITYGGSPPYAWLWSTGHTTPAITGLAAGTYSVTVTSSMGPHGVYSVTIPQRRCPGPQIVFPPIQIPGWN